MSLLPFMFMGKIQAFESEGADSINERLWKGGIRELVLGDLVLNQGEVSGPAFAPNLDFYANTGGRPPLLPPALSLARCSWSRPAPSAAASRASQTAAMASRSSGKEPR